MITIDQALTRSQNRIEAHLADHLRAHATRLLLEGTDPDDVDAIVQHVAQENAAVVADHLSTLRAELLAWLHEGRGTEQGR